MQLKKFYKTGAYLLLFIIIIVISLLAIKTLGEISGEIRTTASYDTLKNSLNILNLYIILLAAVPSIVILLILFINFFNKSISVNISDNKADDQALTDEIQEKKDISDKEKIELEKKEKERIYKETKNNLKETLKELITKKSNDTKAISEKVLSGISKYYEIVQGEIYLKEKKDKKDILSLSAAYAYFIPEGKIFEFEIGEGLIGQVAKERKILNLKNVPDGYIKIASGLGGATPSNLIIIPMINNKEELLGIIELASFKQFNDIDEKILEEIGGVVCQFYQINEK
ncbi:MAG: GAF domain-containing protein [Bacteroidetes bacterium]|nr:GAF domain-containing protein [Bacteroidota bacterium]